MSFLFRLKLSVLFHSKTTIQYETLENQQKRKWVGLGRSTNLGAFQQQ